jgi:hypothetical protein
MINQQIEVFSMLMKVLLLSVPYLSYQMMEYNRMGNKTTLRKQKMTDAILVGWLAMRKSEKSSDPGMVFMVFL